MYWNNTNNNTLPVSSVGKYASYSHMTPTIPEGYNCDKFQSSDVIFMGSCDLDGPIDNTYDSWARRLHTDIIKDTPTTPYIALAKISAGFTSMPRRLATFCEKYGPPKRIFAVIPRPVAIEVPLSTGHIVSVSNRQTFILFLKSHNLINDEDFELLTTACNFCQSQINNHNYQLYQFQQSATFMEMICNNYNIYFKWTINLSAAAIIYYKKYLLSFMENTPFMSATFSGIGIAKDFSFDGSMGNESQLAIYNIFSNNYSKYDAGYASYMLDANVKTAKEQTTHLQQAQ